MNILYKIYIKKTIIEIVFFEIENRYDLFDTISS